MKFLLITVSDIDFMSKIQLLNWSVNEALNMQKRVSWV